MKYIGILTIFFCICRAPAMQYQCFVDHETKKYQEKYRALQEHCTNNAVAIKKDNIGNAIALIPQQSRFLAPRFNDNNEYATILHSLTGKRIGDLKDNNAHSLASITVNRVGTQAIIGRCQKKASVWDVETQRKIITIHYPPEHKTIASHVYLSPDEKEVWIYFPGYYTEINQKHKSSYCPGIIERYDKNTGIYIGRIAQDFSSLSPDRTLGVQRRENKENNKVEFIIKETVNGNERGSFTMDNNVFDIPVLSPDNTTMAVFDGVALSQDQFWLKIIDFVKGKQTSACTNHEPVGNALFDPAGSYLFVGNNDSTANKINIFDVNTGKKYKELIMKLQVGARLNGATILDPAQQALDINDDYFAACVRTNHGTIASVWQHYLQYDNTCDVM